MKKEILPALKKLPRRKNMPFLKLLFTNFKNVMFTLVLMKDLMEMILHVKWPDEGDLKGAIFGNLWHF